MKAFLNNAATMLRHDKLSAKRKLDREKETQGERQTHKTTDMTVLQLQRRMIIERKIIVVVPYIYFIIKIMYILFIPGQIFFADQPTKRHPEIESIRRTFRTF